MSKDGLKGIMKIERRLMVSIPLGIAALLVGVWFCNFTVTPLDRPFVLSSKKETIVASRINWMCNCANFVDTTEYDANPVTELGSEEFFFIEATQQDRQLIRDHYTRNMYARLTGQFYIDKGIPEDFALGHIEDKPAHARVFKIDKIEYLTTGD